MLYLKKANTDDTEKEYLFVRDVPADENGFINEYPDSKERPVAEKYIEKCKKVTKNVTE